MENKSIEPKIYYILVNAKGERLYQYPITKFIDVIEIYRRNAVNKGITCRIATVEL